MSELDEIRTRHEAGERGSAVDDREWLLGEVERLTRECDTALENARWLLAHVSRLARERDEARAEVERLRESIRTMRARCVELDDSDAVSAVMDIASSVLDGEP